MNIQYNTLQLLNPPLIITQKTVMIIHLIYYLLHTYLSLDIFFLSKSLVLIHFLKHNAATHSVVWEHLKEI